MNSRIPITTPIPSGTTSPSKAAATARDNIKRYMNVLTSLASRSSSSDLEWEPFPLKDEFMGLREAGFVTGELGSVVMHSHFPEGTEILSNAGITVDGVVKLAELSEYLWRTSVTGKVVGSLVQLLWLIVGVVIGYMSTILPAQ